jgi:branched-chain amino acid transport system substrate-binding protein
MEGKMKKKEFIIVSVLLVLLSVIPAYSAEMKLPEKITIGAILPLSGNAASYGIPGQNGVNMALEEINAQGGVKGIKIEVKIEDHQTKPEVGVTVLTKLINIYKIPFSIASYSGVIMAQQPVAKLKKIVLMNCYAQSNLLAGVSDYVFSVIPLSGIEIEQLANYWVKDKGYKTAGLISSTDEAGVDAKEVFRKYFEKAGGKITASETFPLNSADHRAILEKIKSTNPDVLSIMSSGKDIAIVIKQAREIGMKQPMGSTTWAMIPDVWEAPDAQGFIYTAAKVPAATGFVDKYKSKFKEDPTTYAITSYNGTKVFAQALKYAIEKGYGIDGEAIRKAINELRTFTTEAGKVSFREDHTSIGDVEVKEIRKPGKKPDVVVLKTATPTN